MVIQISQLVNFYVVTADANADTVIEVSLTKGGTPLQAGGSGAGTTNDYEGGQVLTDSRLQVGFVF